MESDKACWCGIAEGHGSDYDAIRLYAVAPRGFMNKWKEKPSGNYLPEIELTKHDRQLRGEMVLQLA